MYKCTSGCLNIIIAVIFELYKCTSDWLSTQYTVCLLYIKQLYSRCTFVHLAEYLHSTQCACCTSLMYVISECTDVHLAA